MGDIEFRDIHKHPDIDAIKVYLGMSYVRYIEHIKLDRIIDEFREDLCLDETEELNLKDVSILDKVLLSFEPAYTISAKMFRDAYNDFQSKLKDRSRRYLNLSEDRGNDRPRRGSFGISDYYITAAYLKGELKDYTLEDVFIMYLLAKMLYYPEVVISNIASYVIGVMRKESLLDNIKQDYEMEVEWDNY